MSTPVADVVISGVGLVTGLGGDASTTWRAVREGRCGWRPLTVLEGPANEGRFGSEAVGAPGTSGCSREVCHLRRVLREAIMDACLAADSPYSAARTACVLGTTLHGMRRAGEFLRGASASVLAGFLAAPVMRDALDGLSVGGPRLTTCAACSSGLASVELAITLLRTHEADVVIAGGYDAISEYAYAGFDSLRLIAPGPARPFCRGREGMNIAEGYAIIILERAPDAARRGARALASVLAVASSSDCHHLTQPHPEGEGAQRAIHAALHEAGLEPSAIGMVAAHATSTPNNDAAEYNALNAVFGEGLARVPVVAFKSHLGHTLGGAGAAELVLSALSLRDQAVPPTANVTAKQVEYPGLNLNTASLSPARIDATLSLSLGFGGANSCAILGPAPGRTGLTPPARTTRDVYITGVGVVAPAAVGNQAFASLLTGAPRPLLIDPGALDEAAIAHLLQARRVRRMSDYVKLTLASAAVAFEDARINDTSAFGRDCAAILGTTHGSAGYSETYYRQIVAEGIVGANPMLFAEGVPNAGAAQLSTMFGIKGSCQTIIGSRTAGLDALWVAALRISSGQLDRAIVGAAEEYCGVVNEAYARQDLYATAEAHPFSGHGFRAGACGVAIILESDESVRARGGRIRAAVERGRSLAGTGPLGVARAVASALEAAGSPDQILCSASGSWLDRAEAIGMAASRRGRTPVIAGTVAGHLGETFSAGPLAALAGVLLTDRFPASPQVSTSPRNIRAFQPAAASRPFGVLSTDWWGGASALCVGSGPSAVPERV